MIALNLGGENLMKHKHAKEMYEYSQDALKTGKPWGLWERKAIESVRGLCVSDGRWHKCSRQQTMWLQDFDYRHIGPYRELSEAQERGEDVEWLNHDGKWILPCEDFAEKWYFKATADRYRIRPKTKKLYLWAYECNDGDWDITSTYFATREDMEKDYCNCVQVKRLDNTMIEVED